MGLTYSLMCFDCRVLLPIGKMYNFADGRELDEIGFSGIYDVRHDGADAGVLFARTMMAFLFLHRNHELRFVNDKDEDRVELLAGMCAEDVDERTLPAQAREASEVWDPDEELKYWAKWWEQRANRGGDDA